MKKSIHLLPFILLLCLTYNTNAQSLIFRRAILPTDTITEDGVTFAVSSDDAEQENDEMDSLFDDDLDAGWEGAPEDQNILSTGLRFRNVQLPKGAVIDSAFILIWSHEGKSADDIARITIAAEAADNASTYTETALITDRTRTSANVLWEVKEDWEIWEAYRTPDVKQLVQEVIDRNGWASGNALAFMLLGQNQGLSEVENAREFESFENIADPEDGGDGQNHPERRPQLLVYYSVNNGRLEIPIMMTDTISEDGITFEVSSDDAEQENDEIDSLFDDDLDAGWEGAPEDQNILTTGLRFREVYLPKNAVIDSAFIRVWSHEGKSADDVARITIVGEAADQAETYTETALISARPQTTAKVVWEVKEDWEIWAPYRTPELKGIIQEIIGRSGWQSGNAIAFSFLGENQGLSEVENAREFESYENIADPEDGGDGQNHPERRPRLVIYFSSPTSAVNDIFGVPKAEALKIYPNPTHNGSAIVEFNSDTEAFVRLVDLRGQVLRSNTTNGGKRFSLNTAHLPAGVYFVQAVQDGALYVQRLIVE